MDLMYCRDSEEPNSWLFESLKDDLEQRRDQKVTSTCGGFHSHGGTPIAGWLWKNPIEMDDLVI